MRNVATCVLAAVAPAFLASAALAIPNSVLHAHANPDKVDYDTTWIRDMTDEKQPDPDPDDPWGMMHQHRDTDVLTGGNGKYVGNSVWDDGEYRYTNADGVAGNDIVDWGHGYQAAPAGYAFDEGFPDDAQTDFNAAVDHWEGVVNGLELNSNGAPIKTQIDFEEVGDGTHKIDVTWTDVIRTGRLGQFNRVETKFTFNENPTITYQADPGRHVEVSLNRGLAAVWGPNVMWPTNWHFGGGAGGQPPTETRTIYGHPVTDPNAIEEIRITYGRPDFYTTALHELGHAWGLEHFAGGIMNETLDLQAPVSRTLDAGSVDGLKDMYSIAVSVRPFQLFLVEPQWYGWPPAQSSAVKYNADSKTLSIDDIQVEDLSGGDYPDDPWMGAKVSISDFTLNEDWQGDGFLFQNEDGLIAITKGEDVLFEAAISYLLVDDESQAEYGFNIWSALEGASINTELDSAFAWDYQAAMAEHPRFWSQLFLRTEDPLAQVTEDFWTSATTRLVDAAGGQAIPEPSTMVMLLGLGVALLIWRRRRIS